MDCLSVLQFLITSPLMSIVLVIIISMEIGFNVTIVMIITLAVIVFIQTVLSYLSGSYYGWITFFSDKRVNSVRELCSAVKLVKMNAWERNFEVKIKEQRRKELLVNFKSLIIEAIPSAMGIVAPHIVLFAVLIAMYLFKQIEHLTVAKFLYISLMLGTFEDHLFNTFATAMFHIAEAYESFERIIVSILLSLSFFFFFLT